MSFKKITEADLAGLGVIGMADAPGLAARAMQEKLEEVVRAAVIPAFNRLVEELAAKTAAESLGAADGEEESNVQAVLEKLSAAVGEALTAARLNEADGAEMVGARKGGEKSNVQAVLDLLAAEIAERAEELAAAIAEQVDGLSAAAAADRVNTEEAISTALQTALAYTNQMAFEAGSADMFRSVYDPDGHECDIYGYAREQAGAAAEEAAQTAREAAQAAAGAEAAAGTAQESADEARAYAQVLLSHTKSGTVHTLAGLDGRSGVLAAMFRATGGYAEGNTFKVDGTVYTAKMPDGEGLSDGAFASGSVVGVIIDTENKTVNFKGGGGVKLPALSNPAAAAQIFSGYEAIDGAGQAMTGTAGSSITKAATAARIEKGYQALTKAGVMLTGTLSAYKMATGSLSGFSSTSDKTVTKGSKIIAVVAEGTASGYEYTAGVATEGVTVKYGAYKTAAPAKYSTVEFSGNTATFSFRGTDSFTACNYFVFYQE